MTKASRTTGLGASGIESTASHGGNVLMAVLIEIAGLILAAGSGSL